MPETTARPNMREIATTGDGQDITRGFVGPILPNPDTILSTRAGGDLRVYADVKRDDQVFSAIDQRKRAVISREWFVEPGGDSSEDKAAAEFMREQIHQVGWDRITDKMLNAVYYGYAVAEILLARDGAQVVLDNVKVRDLRRFRYTPKGELRLLTMESPLEGIPAEPGKFWHIATGGDHDDEYYGLGLAHYLYWPVLFKRSGVKFWSIFLDKYGSPTAKGTFQPGSTQTDRDRLLNALQSIQTDSAIIVPEGVEVELLQAMRAASGDYSLFYAAMDRAITKVILGHTGASESAAGRLGGEDMASEVRMDIVKADADLICESWNRGPGKWLTQWNFPTANVPRVYRDIEEPEDLNARSERDSKLYSMGFKPTLKAVTEAYGPGYEEREIQTPPALPVRDNPEFADGDAGDAADSLATELEDATTSITDDMIRPIADLVDRADSEGWEMSELRDRLMQQFPAVDHSALGSILAQAMAAAELSGRADVEDGN